MTRAPKRGFTLIELLVVVAIIAVLIAILLPSLGRARKVAKTARCLANVRAMTTTLNLYMSDRQALLPYSREGTDYFWTIVLREYGNSNKLGACPEVLDPPTNVGSGISQGTVNRPWFVANANPRLVSTGAYGINGWIQTAPSPQNWGLIQTSNGGTPNPVPRSAFYYKIPIVGTALSSIPVMTDACWPDAWPLEDSEPPVNLTDGVGSTNGDMMRRFILSRHNKAVNVGFLDNHAETVQLQDMWGLKWHTQWKANGLKAGKRLPAK